MALNPTDAENYTGAVAPTYSTAGGYVPGQVESNNGGYDPNNPSYGNQSNSIGGAWAQTETYSGAPTYDNRGGYVPGQEESTGGGDDPTTTSLDSAEARRSLLPENAAGDATAVDTTVTFQSQASDTNSAGAPAEDDWRVRISLPDSASILYKDFSNSVLRPLTETNGVIFPYTPQITITHAANYSSITPTHSNYPLHFYNNSEVNDIQIMGEFSVQSIDEGKYLMAAIYFFRSATKMFFGQGANAGNPPPMVFLDGYGSHYFPHVPCVISGFTHILPQDVDYIQIPVTTTTLEKTQIQPDSTASGVNLYDNGSGVLTSESYAPNFGANQEEAKNTVQMSYKQTISATRVPTNSSITITLKPVYSRKNLHDRFNLDLFSKGLLLGDKSTGFGGFI
jgi:hypothetical protein